MATLSVLIPVYNAAPYLAETLDSVLQQSAQADQIVIVNDGSTDQSLELLTAYQQREERILLIDQPNGGVSQARNKGLSQCAGDFVALVDADDICLPTRFQIQLNTLKYKGADICGSWMKNFGSSNRLNKYPTRSDQLKWNYFFFGRTIPNPSAMFRRSSIGATRYNENLAFGEDYAFFLASLISNPGIRLTNISKPLIRYRTHPEQASRRLREQNLTNLGLICNELLPHPSDKPSEPLMAAHLKLWLKQQALTTDELASYLPQMAFWSDWLCQQADAPGPAASQWISLMRRHRTDGNALKLINQYAQPYLGGWKGNFARLLAHLS